MEFMEVIPFSVRIGLTHLMTKPYQYWSFFTLIGKDPCQH